MDSPVTIPSELEQDMIDTEFKVRTGLTLSDMLREGIPLVDHAIGSWGDGVRSGCALTTVARALNEKGYSSVE